MIGCSKQKCIGCLRVTHTYCAGKRGKTQRLVCDACGMIYTATTLIAPVNGHGEGAAAVAKRLLRSKRDPSCP